MTDAGFSDYGLSDFLSKYFAAYPTLWIGLFTSTNRPAAGAALVDISECAGNGYGRIALDAGGWTVVANKITHTQVSFEVTGDCGNVYGYYIATSQDNTGNNLFSEKIIDAPYHLTTGRPIRPTIAVTLANPI